MYYRTAECINSPRKIWISYGQSKDSYKTAHYSKLIYKEYLMDFIKSLYDELENNYTFIGDIKYGRKRNN